MDSGASFHAISCPDMVKNLRTGNFGKVRLVDDQMLDITGVGDVDLKTSLGTIWTLKDVRVIPNLRRKLISVGKLDDEGFNVHFGGGQWKVIKGNLVIAKGKKQGTLYMAEIHAEGVHAMTTSPSPSTLWHNRLEHMSKKGLKMLAKKGKFPDLKKVETEFCESCVFGKQKRITFVKTGRAPKAQKLELVHSDVYGPTSVSSLGGSRYYVTSIDDSTRKVKCLKSDNGGE
ncbi:putative RNA-directed DNA polymerase [Helianthus debilis subsp. tardiflorus]